ncbi:two component transcriptional regulator, winged helix family [Thermobaculum terrenum ATCC BAA-798]|uniref:Two component transcriptional regulator, winged helix family n=1 Tax=Thermobaculum terrenum (strain ATCC BAA-798 / CCMEE 7001 / YNP1) TaxID=525904 RepID=D1CJ29_THET1|nr:response regulator transcription factor [Thermobaculum terrenum]ACZ43749.1 two component transcriptional regulator, winged helix family [Thermobaculum terrenum ATCC BAA-798]
MTTVLLVEDESTLLTTIAYNLRREGYKVLTAENGKRALELAEENPDIVVLDILLPEIDGLEVCRRLRQRSSVPIIMLTAKTDEVDRIVGLELGADDYLTKPFSMRELLARIKALLRRRSLIMAEISSQQQESRRQKLVSGDLEIDPAMHQVKRGGKVIQLTPREFDLLTFLVMNKGIVFSAERLLEEVWGYDEALDVRTVPVHIRNLREKIEDDPSDPKRIETVRGVGYRFSG